MINLRIVKNPYYLLTFSLKLLIECHWSIGKGSKYIIIYMFLYLFLFDSLIY